MNRNNQTQLADLDSLALSASEAIIIHRKIKILDVNKTLAAMFGYEPDELSDITSWI